MSMKLQKSEWRLVFLLALGILLVSSLPYLFGYLSAPDDLVFMGIAYGTSDTTQYFSWLRGFQTSFLIDNHLTPEPNARIFLNLQWWLLAQTQRLASLSHIQVFHLFRVLAILVFNVASYWFIALCFQDLGRRRTAFLVTQLGSGLGWIWVMLKYLTGSPEITYPLDVYAIEPNSFLSQMAFPHFTAAAALIIVIFALMLIAVQRQQWRFSLVASGAALVLGLSHAYDLLLIYAVIGLFVLAVWLRDQFTWKSFWQVLVLGLISCGPAFYSVYITSDKFPVWHDVLAQFDLAGAWTPDPFHLLFLMGLPFIITLIGYDGVVRLKERSLSGLFVRIWFITNFFLIFLPVNFQIHYLNGWQLPIAILATEILYERLVPWVKELRIRGAGRLGRWLPILLVLVVLPTNLYLLAWRILDLGRHESPYYIHQDEQAALVWLNDNANEEQVVLSAQEIGRYVPAWTGARSFLGHWAMTKDLHEKQSLVRSFFSADSPDEARWQILSEFSVDYVLWGTVEQALGSFDPRTAPYLSPCFSEPQASVFCVQDSQLP